MGVKVFFLSDILTTAIFSVYAFFLRGEEIALMTGLAIFIAFSPVCLILSKFIVLRIARKVIEDTGIKMGDSEALITLAEVDTVATPLNRFLTDGDYFITDLVPEGFSQSSLLSFAASVEQNSSNPIGRVIYKTALGRGLRIQNVTAFNEIPKCGVEAIINGTPIRVGTAHWVSNQGVKISAALMTKMDQLAVHGKTPLVLGLGDMARGIIALKDDINYDARKFISMLKRNKLDTVALTALNKKTAKNVAKNYSLDVVRTDLSPNDKAREVQILRAKGQILAVIGNEFQDLPAMLNSDVSFLLKDGSMTPINEDSDNIIDFEIPSLENFLAIRDIALRAVKIIKVNRRIAYLSWLVLVPPSIMMSFENPPIMFHPLASLAGVFVFSVIILINSLRMNKSAAEKKPESEEVSNSEHNDDAKE